MEQIQLDHWKQFSLGMAKTSFPTITPARREKLVRSVEECIDWAVCEGLKTVIDWDTTLRTKQGYYNSIGASVQEWLWDNHFEREVHHRNGDSEVVRSRFGKMVMSCVRAGCDVAVAPSGGVIGFKVVRRIFGGVLPDWVKAFFAEGIDMASDEEAVWL